MLFPFYPELQKVITLHQIRMHYEDEKHQTQSPFNWPFLLILHLDVVTSSWNRAPRHGVSCSPEEGSFSLAGP